MHVLLTPELERRVAEKAETGLYASADEVVREGLRLVFGADDIRARQLARSSGASQIGLDQLDRGEGLDRDGSRRRAMARFAAAER